MRKRLIRKTFDMIQEISESENKEVCVLLIKNLLCSLKLIRREIHFRLVLMVSGLQEVLGELW